ncbi:hypothetical protein EW145_g4331 [Phellinidium pouzarii]|uniref:Uncharacterized protein n=1 Tax=Phellinidium pouzarii TaxID=167371 RepID=A0A4S4L5S2_9AGAM|nr:hypothetical protein EW145_g4331 [Phellinidium pouzarii]
MSNALHTETKEVPLGTGPPTREELRVYYTPRFTWTQLRLFINFGDLGLLKRDKALHRRYCKWGDGIKAEYGSMVDYLLNHRLQWGNPDRLSLLPSEIDDSVFPYTSQLQERELSMQHSESRNYFTYDTPPELISIIQNDWPYSVPLEIEHSLVWTKLPILPAPSLIIPCIAATLSPELQEKVSARLAQDGLWGFTGSIDPPPSPTLLPQAMGRLSDWGITLETLVITPKGTEEEERAIQLSGVEVQKFVMKRWIEREWETCWFVNPPRLQSVKDLAHIHVFARKKSPDEMARWDAA